MNRVVKVVLLLLTACVIVVIVNIFLRSLKISKLNRNLDADGLQFLMKIEEMSDLLKSDYTELGGWGGRFFNKNDDSLYIVFSGFPDVLDQYKLTDINIYSSEYSVYGIHTGDSIDLAQKILEAKSYTKIENGSKASNDIYKKGIIEIEVVVRENETIDSIRVKLISTNRDKVVF